MLDFLYSVGWVIEISLNPHTKSSHWQAIETGFGYGQWLHGEAVAAGTVCKLCMTADSWSINFLRAERWCAHITGDGSWHVLPAGVDRGVISEASAQDPAASQFTHITSRNHDHRHVQVCDGGKWSQKNLILTACSIQRNKPVTPIWGATAQVVKAPYPVIHVQ